MPTHEILIVGANFGGLPVAHYLLRHTIPALQNHHPSQAYHVSLLSPSTHHLFKVAAPRVVIAPSKIPTNKIFLPIADGFASYAVDQYTFIQGTATEVSASTRTVTATLPDGHSTEDLRYDTLIIATGTTSASPLWTLHGDHRLSENALKDIHKKLAAAKSILVVGGGPAGVETAAEAGENFSGAQITLFSGGERILPRLKPSVSASAEGKLTRLGVKVQHRLRVVNATEDEEGKTRVELSDGNARVVDVYINATGGRPNSAFLPTEWVDKDGRVRVDGQTLRGNGEGMAGVYAIGDVASYSSGGIMDIMFGVRPLATSVGVDIIEQLQKGKEG